MTCRLLSRSDKWSCPPYCSIVLTRTSTSRVELRHFFSSQRALDKCGSICNIGVHTQIYVLPQGSSLIMNYVKNCEFSNLIETGFCPMVMPNTNAEGYLYRLAYITDYAARYRSLKLFVPTSIERYSNM